MGQIGTPQEILRDVKIKEERVRDFLEREGLDALVLGRQDNFAWVTAGGDNRVINNIALSEGFVVITKDHKWLVAHHMDGRRFIEEQAPDQGYELVTLHWHQGFAADKILELTAGMRVGADFTLPCAQQYGPEIVDLHYPFTDLDLKRLRWVGRKSNEIITRVAEDVKLGMTEIELAARFAYECTLFGHKAMYDIKGEVPEEEYTIPLGVADVKRPGQDVTIVAYSCMVPMSLAAAEKLAQEGIEVEVVDLRTVDPIDEETILTSVKKTNRLVVVQETWRKCSVSSEVAAIVAEKALDYLDAPVIRVTGADVPVPAAPILENYVLPSEAGIIEAVRRSVAS